MKTRLKIHEKPYSSGVSIGGIPFLEYCPICGKDCQPAKREEIFEQVKSAAYEIIDRKGYTNFAVALALVRIVSAILRDEDSVLIVSTLIDDYYGIRGILPERTRDLEQPGSIPAAETHSFRIESRKPQGLRRRAQGDPESSYNLRNGGAQPQGLKFSRPHNTRRRFRTGAIFFPEAFYTT